MKSFHASVRPRIGGTAAMALVLAFSAMPAHAQEVTAKRIEKVEAEVRALQRKVFPGPDGKYFTPEIAPGAAPAVTPSATSTPVTDLLTRMDTLETQMQRLTAQVELNTNRIGQLEAKLGGVAPAVVAPVTSGGTATVTTPAAVTSTPATTASVPTAQPAAASIAAPAPKPAAVAAPPPSRVAAVKAIVKPATDDAGDDEYSYGYRLWEAKFQPEAQQQLKLFLEKYPRHSRTSYARNLLGRSYLDEGNPGEAAKWFLQNYQTDKRGERAPDSLLYLAAAMKQMKDTKRACIALAEFGNSYAAEAAGRLKPVYDSTRSGLSCTS